MFSNVHVRDCRSQLVLCVLLRQTMHILAGLFWLARGVQHSWLAIVQIFLVLHGTILHLVLGAAMFQNIPSRGMDWKLLCVPDICQPACQVLCERVPVVGLTRFKPPRHRCVHVCIRMQPVNTCAFASEHTGATLLHSSCLW